MAVKQGHTWHSLVLSLLSRCDPCMKCSKLFHVSLPKRQGWEDPEEEPSRIDETMMNCDKSDTKNSLALQLQVVERCQKLEETLDGAWLCGADGVGV